MVCIIPSHNQTKYIKHIIDGFNKQIVLPSMIFFVFDRCKESIKELSKINSNIPIDFVEKENGVSFDAGATRDFGLSKYIEKYGMPEHVLFTDGDCIPNEYVIAEHIENLNRIDTPILSCGRRIQYDKNDKSLGDKRDFHLDKFFREKLPNTVFTSKNGKLCHNEFFNNYSCISHSCNLAINRKAIELSYMVNKLLNCENRIFHKTFDGRWGGEDNFIGQIIFATTGYIFACSNKSHVIHKWHPTSNHIHYNNFNLKKCKFFLRDVKRLIHKGIIPSDNIIDLYKNHIEIDIIFDDVGKIILHDSYGINEKINIIKKNNIYDDLVKYSIDKTEFNDKKLKEEYIKLFYSRNVNIKYFDKHIKYVKSKEYQLEFKNFLKELFNLYVTIKDGKASGY